jgi:hypothetical protein
LPLVIASVLPLAPSPIPATTPQEKEPGKEVVRGLSSHGNELAQKWLASRHQEKGIVIKATGSRQGDLPCAAH